MRKPLSNATIQLPSQFQLGDYVILNFMTAGSLSGGHIVKVHFTEKKVLYDVELEMFNMESEGEICWTRLYNIDSVFVNRVSAE